MSRFGFPEVLPYVSHSHKVKRSKATLKLAFQRNKHNILVTRSRLTARRLYVSALQLEEYGEIDEVTEQLPFSRAFQNDFLKNYWQQRPLLFRQAIPKFDGLLSPEELAGLACEDGVACRLIQPTESEKPWDLKYGPFNESDFTNLPKSNYSLLVRGVDRHVPEVSELLSLFSFVPRWRMDDIMISYSPQDGTIGPHSDSFDVFLLQTGGLKSWEVSSEKFDPDDDDLHVDGCAVRRLKEWQAGKQSQARRILEAGDMLYVPPQIAHCGVALEPSLTYSIGFLAPKHQDLLLSFVDTIATDEIGSERWSDPDLTIQEHSGEITEATVEKADKILSDMLKRRGQVAQWLGAHLTEPQGGPDPEQLQPPMDWMEFHQTLSQMGEVRVLESVKMAFMCNQTLKDSSDKNGGLLFANGQAAPITDKRTKAVMRSLCDDRILTLDQLTAAGIDTDIAKKGTVSYSTQELLLSLVNEGMIYFLESDEGEE